MICPVALVLSYVPRIRVIYHEHDSPCDVVGASLFQRLVAWSRHKLGVRAQAVVLPNEGRAAVFRNQTGRDHTYCVWNCPSRQEVSEMEPDHRHANTTYVLYHGSINRIRVPESIVSAFEQLPDSVHFRLIGYETVGSQGYAQHLQSLFEAAGMGDRFEYVGAVPQRSDLLSWCRASHIGLAFMPTSSNDINMQNMVGASNKPFDYMSCGVAVVVSDLPDWREFLVDPGYAVACDPSDGASIAAAVRVYLDDAQATQESIARSHQRMCDEWNYDSQFTAVKDLICAEGVVERETE
ncbi:MAG: glycosyltransferase [Planctomycetaceae bacterium]